MLDKYFPHFLSKEDLLKIRRGKCIFCDKPLNRNLISERVRIECGREYSSTYEVLYKTFLVSDMDIYLFAFEFNESVKEGLKEEENKVLERLERLVIKRKEDGEQLRRELEDKFSKIDISEEYRIIACEAVVNDFLSVLPGFSIYSPTPLQQEVGYLFHNLQLGDLSLIYDTDDFDEELSGEGKFDSIRVNYLPRKLKTHKKCWPFLQFDNSKEFDMKLKEFLVQLKLNPQFEKYEELFKDFPDLWNSMLEESIKINAKTYNPVDFM